jgi:hypothetical protein
MACQRGLARTGEEEVVEIRGVGVDELGPEAAERRLTPTQQHQAA